MRCNICLYYHRHILHRLDTAGDSELFRVNSSQGKPLEEPRLRIANGAFGAQQGPTPTEYDPTGVQRAGYGSGHRQRAGDTNLPEAVKAFQPSAKMLCFITDLKCGEGEMDMPCVADFFLVLPLIMKTFKKTN